MKVAESAFANYAAAAGYGNMEVANSAQLVRLGIPLSTGIGS